MLSGFVFLAIVFAWSIAFVFLYPHPAPLERTHRRYLTLALLLTLSGLVAFVLLNLLKT